MGMDNVSDKVNINVGDGGGRGYGDGGQAAMIAALLNGRNQDSGQVGMLAALMNNRAVDGGFGGAGGLGIIALLALLGGGRGGFFGGRGDECCDNDHGVSPAQAAILQTLLEGQSDLRAQVPTTALETQNAIQQAISSLALGTQQMGANLGDKVTNSASVLATAIGTVNQNVLEQGCQTRAQVLQSENNIIRRIDDARIDEANRRGDRFEIQAQFASQFAALQSKVEVNQTVNTNQQQQQQIRDDDRRHHELMTALFSIGNQVQRVKSDQDIVNFGTMAASGNQATTSTQVR